MNKRGELVSIFTANWELTTDEIHVLFEVCRCLEKMLEKEGRKLVFSKGG